MDSRPHCGLRRLACAVMAVCALLVVIAVPPLNAAGARTVSQDRIAPTLVREGTSGEMAGEAITGSMGIVETTGQIMARQALLAGKPHEPLPDLPHAVDWSAKTGWSDLPQGPISVGAAPQASTTGLSLGLGFDGPGSTTNFCGTPPDTMGAVGPTQYVIFVNCNIVSYNKFTGAADGVLNTTPNVFFSTVRSSDVTDPHIQYDRLTGRWFMVIQDITFPNNRILLAVSSDAVIGLGTAWTLFYFQTANGTHTSCLADYPTPGIDANAIYIGMNQFCGSSLGTATYAGSDLFVVRKSSVLGAGPVAVAAFGSVSDTYTAQGVDNPDPAAAEGYVVGASLSSWSRINLFRVGSPGGTPTLSSVIPIATANQGMQISQPHMGNTGGTNGRLDGGDNRLMAAYYRNGSLWTAAGIGVDVNCAGVAGGTATRDAMFWWELRGIPTGSTPFIAQSGKVCDPAVTNPLFYSFGTIVVNGQGHAALGYTFTGANAYTSVGVATRLAGDAAGTLPSALVAVAGANAYNPAFDSGASRGARRWGDYSYTSVDPCDDMTIWTVQEYANPANQYRERVTQLMAPPPAQPASANPSVISAGQAGITVSVVGTSAGGSGFYDTPASMSGQYCRKRITATVSGGVVVNSVVYTDPTHILLNLSTQAAAAGTYTVTVTNPDGQTASAAILHVLTPRLYLPLALRQ